MVKKICAGNEYTQMSGFQRPSLTVTRVPDTGARLGLLGLAYGYSVGVAEKCKFVHGT